MRLKTVALFLIAITLTLSIGLFSHGSSAQTSDALRLASPNSAGAIANPQTPATDVTTADISIDGRSIIRITVTPNTVTLRKESVEDVLLSMVATSAKTNYAIEVEPKTLNGSWNIYARVVNPNATDLDRVAFETRLFSVLDTDIQLYGRNAEEVAKSMADSLEESLKLSVQERSKDAFYEQIKRFLVVTITTVAVELFLIFALFRLGRQSSRILWVEVFLWSSTLAVPALGGILMLGIFPIARTWQVMLLSLTRSFLIIMGSVMLSIVLIRIVDRVVGRLEETLTEAGAESRTKSIRTTFDICRSVIYALMFSGGALIGLSIAGVNTAPVIAGAGIIGLAVSLASQDLIKDYISGSTILLNQTYGTGDVITIGQYTGMVEEISLRQTTLRNGDGERITIPNRSASTVVNLTKEWSRVTLKLTMPSELEPKVVDSFMNELLEDLEIEPEMAAVILERELLTVDAIDGHGNIVYLIWIKVKPLEQWRVKRRLMWLFWQKCHEHKIALPGPKVTASVELENAFQSVN
jgi:small-conductance mechanosensitive channel